MKRYDEMIAKMAENTQITTKDVDIDTLIIDHSAQTKVNETVDFLFGRIHKILDKEVNSILAPRFAFENVSESGIMICGKEGNIATAKNTFFELFSAFQKECDLECFKKATYLAGRKSALQFSDDFRKIMTIDGITQLPNSEEKFMHLYSKFDCRSAWWEEPVDYLDERTPVAPYVSAIIKKPFTSYPWLDKESEKNNLFMRGYIQTLFNCSSDILRVISEVNNIKMGERKFAVRIVRFDEPDQEKEYLHIHYSDCYVGRWLEIDKAIYLMVSLLLTAEKKENIVELVNMFDELSELLKEITGLDMKSTEVYKNIIAAVQESLRDVEADKFRLRFLLNEIRIIYEDYRIEKLSDDLMGIE